MAKRVKWNTEGKKWKKDTLIPFIHQVCGLVIKDGVVYSKDGTELGKLESILLTKKEDI